MPHCSLVGWWCLFCLKPFLWLFIDAYLKNLWGGCQCLRSCSSATSSISEINQARWGFMALIFMFLVLPDWSEILYLSFIQWIIVGSIVFLHTYLINSNFLSFQEDFFLTSFSPFLAYENLYSDTLSGLTSYISLKGGCYCWDYPMLLFSISQLLWLIISLKNSYPHICHSYF